MDHDSDLVLLRPQRGKGSCPMSSGTSGELMGTSRSVSSRGSIWEIWEWVEFCDESVLFSKEHSDWEDIESA